MHSSFLGSCIDSRSTRQAGRQAGTCGQELSNRHRIACLMGMDIAEMQCLSTGLTRVYLRRNANSAEMKLLGPTLKEKPGSVNCGL